MSLWGCPLFEDFAEAVRDLSERRHAPRAVAACAEGDATTDVVDRMRQIRRVLPDAPSRGGSVR